MEKKKVCVLFPGIGYTCDKPLLYYAAKLAQGAGYEVIRVPYQGFPPKVKGDREKMELSFQMALSQSHEILQDVKWEEYDEILFVGKSVGTIVAGAYAQEKKLQVRSVYFTPLTDTFQFAEGDSVAFHGTGDPWAVTEEIQKACQEKNIPLHLYSRANHSLETGEVYEDIRNLTEAMKIFESFL